MFQYMNYVCEVYKTGSFSKAAKNLYLTQPALSIAIKKEEQELGQPLFERSTSHIALTEAGKAYIESAEKIKNIETSLRLYCNDLSKLKTGSVRVGASNFFLSQIVLSVISEFSRKYPGIDLEIREAPSLELKEKIRKEELDIIIDPMIQEDSMFQSHVLFEEHFLLAVPEKIAAGSGAEAYALSRSQILDGFHLLPGCPKVPLSLFADKPFILLRPETVTYGHAMEICESYGFTPKVRFFLDQLITSYHFVGKGLGIAFVSDCLVKLTPPEPGVLFFQLDSPLAKREVAAVHKKNRYLSSASAAFIETAKKMIENHQIFT